MIGIYKITNKINGKSYIGQSIDIERRWKEHRRSIGLNKNSLYLDFEKYGIDNFTFEILEECATEMLNEREHYWIEYYDTYNNGYNLTQGGDYNRIKIKGKSGFFFDKNWSLTIEGLAHDFGEDYAKELVYNIYLYGIKGENTSSVPSIKGFIDAFIAPFIQKQ